MLMLVNLTCVLKVGERLIGFTHNIGVAIDINDRLFPHVEPHDPPLTCTITESSKHWTSAVVEAANVRL